MENEFQGQYDKKLLFLRLFFDWY